MTIIDEQGLSEDHPRIAAEMEQGLQASVSISAPVADTAELRRALAHVLPALLDEQSEVSSEEEGRLHSTRLTAQERAVLRQFLSAPRQWFSATEIANYLTRQGLLSARAQSPERSVMSIISQLRLKLADNQHTLIRLNRRIGYAIFPQDRMG
jgi:DNA-binding response OmpR family regulator